jgi:hypothetical protein
VTERIVAHVDEAGAKLPGDRRLYVLAAVLTSLCDHPSIKAQLTALRLGDRFLHYYDELPERRLLIAKVISQLPLHGGIVLITSSGNTGQEHARCRLMTQLLPRLEHVEQASEVIIESRAGGDRHDRRTRDRLRRSRKISAGLRVDHAGKTEPMLWLADFVASAYVGARYHGDMEPWDILNGSHTIDVIDAG